MSSEKYQNYVSKLEKETAMIHGTPDVEEVTDLPVDQILGGHHEK